MQIIIIGTARLVAKLKKYDTCTTETSKMEYSPEELNFLGLIYIALNLVPDGLRKIFKQEWDFLYKTTNLGKWNDTPQNGRAFFNLESVGSHRRYPGYLAIIRDGNTAEWDYTCLFFAILFSDSIGTNLSPAVKKNIDDLRRICIDIVHCAEAKLSDAEFQHFTGKVIAAFSSLQLPITDIEAVKNRVHFTTAEEHPEAPASDYTLAFDYRKFWHLRQFKEYDKKALMTHADASEGNCKG